MKHMTPFTYRYMPASRYLKELLAQGYIGQPYHLNLRYYTGYGRDARYEWRFDLGQAGAGAVGDIGSHFLYLASWYFGEIARVTCQLSHNVARPMLNPDGHAYIQADDATMLMLSFQSGAQGVIHVSTVGYEETPFGQTPRLGVPWLRRHPLQHDGLG